MKLNHNLSNRYLIIAWIFGVIFQPVMAQDALSPRVQIGLSLFPSVVAADMYLENQLDSNKRLKLYIVYQSDELLARRLQDKLSAVPSIRNIEINVEMLPITKLLNSQEAVKGAIFLAEPAGGDINALVELSKNNRILVFSSFEGDVEQGITSGYQVTNKVLPLVNMRSLKQANIRLKAFFLRVAVKYE